MGYKMHFKWISKGLMKNTMNSWCSRGRLQFYCKTKKLTESSLELSTFLNPWYNIFISRAQPKKEEVQWALIKLKKKEVEISTYQRWETYHEGKKQKEKQRVFSPSWSLSHISEPGKCNQHRLQRDPRRMLDFYILPQARSSQVL